MNPLDTAKRWLVPRRVLLGYVTLAVTLALALYWTQQRADDQNHRSITELCSHLSVVETNQRQVLIELATLRTFIIANPASTPAERTYAERSLQRIRAAQARINLVGCK